jgi:hypothetical protein
VLRLRLLSWNLGPESPRWQDLAAVLAGWEWDVAALRGLAPRWPLPLARALDAEFRYAPAGGEAGSRLGRLLSWGPAPLTRQAGGRVDAIVARRDRIVSEWPADHRHVQRAGVHVARLACGVWIGTHDGGEDPAATRSALTAAVGDDALALAGPRETIGINSTGDGLPHRALTQVAGGGADGIWATSDLIPLAEVEVLAGGAVQGNPPLAVTLEHRAQVQPRLDRRRQGQPELR